MSEPPVKDGSGLGDKVAAVTEALGIKKRPGCGCHRRQKALNEVKTDQSMIGIAKDVVKAIVKS